MIADSRLPKRIVRVGDTGRYELLIFFQVIQECFDSQLYWINERGIYPNRGMSEFAGPC